MVEHFWQALPGPQWFAGRQIFEQQVERCADGAVFVELGAWKGRSTTCMAVEIANSGKDIKFYSVDHWLGSLEQIAPRQDEDLLNNRLYDVYLRNIEPVAAYVVPIRSDSAEAASRFADATVDFIYVDAAHTFTGMTRDLGAWWPKLKAGGTIAGDDWCFLDAESGELGVRRAVQEFFARLDYPVVTHPGDPDTEWEQWSVTKTTS